MGCKTVASIIKSKPPKEIHNMFNITKDSSDEEEEQIRRAAPHIPAVHVRRSPTPIFSIL